MWPKVQARSLLLSLERDLILHELGKRDADRDDGRRRERRLPGFGKFRFRGRFAYRQDCREAHRIAGAVTVARAEAQVHNKGNDGCAESLV